VAGAKHDNGEFKTRTEVETLKTLSLGVQDLLNSEEGETAEWSLDLAVAELFPDLKVKSRLKGNLQALRTADGLILIVREAELKVQSTCVRCAEAADLTLKLKDATREFLEHWNESEEEAFPIDLERLEVDLSEFVRQELYLVLPELIYCKPKCKGVCDQCGQNLNRGTCHCQKAANQEENPFQKLKDMLKEQ